MTTPAPSMDMGSEADETNEVGPIPEEEVSDASPTPEDDENEDKGSVETIEGR